MNNTGKTSFFYSKLALTNLKKNSRTYFPYILTAIGTIMMFYMMHSISQNEGLSKMSGGESLKEMLALGNWIIAIFSSIFLFYTNSFLIKRRKKEIGLYNILGMEKRHIRRMMAIETLFVFLISLVVGLLGGMLFSKLMFLLLIKITHFDVSLKFAVSWLSVFYTSLLFAAIFFVTLLFNIGQIHIAKPVELLKGGNQGEKEPKTKWILALIGLLSLGAGYFLSLSVKSPLEAFSVFFLAVILVIIGTYVLFAAGSIALLKILRKKKSYYYQAKHFTNVSGMIYRMKQNAAGLASICILSTIVLVTVSTTVCLYIGEDSILKSTFPREVEVSVADLSEKDGQVFDDWIKSQAQQLPEKADNFLSYRSTGFAAEKNGDAFTVDESQGTTSNACAVNLMSVEEYNRLEGKTESLADNEVLLSSVKSAGKEVTLLGKTYTVKEKLKDFTLKDLDKDVLDSYFFVVKDETIIKDMISMLPEKRQKYSAITNVVAFDLNGSRDEIVAATEKFEKSVESQYADAGITSRENMRQNFLSVYGGLFFLGLFLGTLFLMATVLIIYYKQVSEGFDDKERFEIMQKVGMSQKEVKKSIHSQIVMVFFLPLVAAIIHIAFAFRVITELLLLFHMNNLMLFIGCTIGVILVFALIYALVYLFTAKSYYRIVRSK